MKIAQELCGVRRGACGEVNVWLWAARVFVAIDVVMLQHYFCRVLVIPNAVGFCVGGPSDPMAEFGAET